MIQIAQTISTVVFLIAICLAAPSYALSPSAAKQMGVNYDTLVKRHAYVASCASEAQGSQPWMALTSSISRYKQSLYDAIAYYHPEYTRGDIARLVERRSASMVQAAKADVATKGCHAIYIQREIRVVAPQYAANSTNNRGEQLLAQAQ